LRSRASANLHLHRNREAIEDLERLCDLGLEGEGARIRLAVANLRLGEFDAAREHYRKALDLNLEPSDEAQVHHHLGVIEGRIGSADHAVEEYRTALALDPDLVGARLDLGSALARRTLRAGSSPSRLETLAMASAEAGLFNEAVKLQRQVIQMMTWEGRFDVLPKLEANLARYWAGQTCCADAPSSE
jgi:tetratricopeptide (TPR) repeat protein